MGTILPSRKLKSPNSVNIKLKRVKATCVCVCTRRELVLGYFTKIHYLVMGSLMGPFIFPLQLSASDLPAGGISTSYLIKSSRFSYIGTN